MENYIGKICPFCKTEITEADTIKVCPACNIPHHESCWQENHGCTTFGCSEQNSVSVKSPLKCFNCGEILNEGQAFCAKCGTAAPAASVNKKCNNCGNELDDNAEFCSKCGQKATLNIDQSVGATIAQYNNTIAKKSKNKVVLPLVIGAVAVIAIVFGIIINNILQEKKLEDAKIEYIENVEEFVSLSLTAGSNLEDIADTVQEYWYDAIWNDMYNDDINTAILYAMIDKSDELDQAETYHSQMQSLYSKIKRIPDGIEDEELEDLCDAVKALYNVYTDYYSFATDPSGNYNSFSDGNNTKTDNFLSAYRALSNLLD